ncbi:hypothetical protein SLE2022_119030 [Rubroshorea leprosula]
MRKKIKISTPIKSLFHLPPLNLLVFILSILFITLHHQLLPTPQIIPFLLPNKSKQKPTKKFRVPPHKDEDKTENGSSATGHNLGGGESEDAWAHASSCKNPNLGSEVIHQSEKPRSRQR